MFSIFIITAILVAILVFLKVFIDYKRKNIKVAAPLIIPFFFYNMIIFIFISGNTDAYFEKYLDRQFFLTSVIFFIVYSMLVVFFLSKTTDNSKK